MILKPTKKQLNQNGIAINKWKTQEVKIESAQMLHLPRTKLCLEGTGIDRKIVLYRNGVKDCIPFPVWAITNVLSNLGLEITSTVNGVSSTIDIADEVKSLIWDIITNIELYEDGVENGIEYTRPDGSVTRLQTGHSETISGSINIPVTVTHNLNSLRVVVSTYDNSTGDEVSVIVTNRTINTLDIITTTNDLIDIVIKK